MKEISGFFDKFKNLALKELNKRETVQSTISKIIKQDINMSNISIKDGIVFVKGNQALKSEIFLKKKLIIEQINKKNIKITDIK